MNTQSSLNTETYVYCLKVLQILLQTEINSCAFPQIFRISE